MNTKKLNVKNVNSCLLTIATCLIMGLPAYAQKKVLPKPQVSKKDSIVEANDELILHGNNQSKIKRVDGKEGPGSGGGGNSCALAIAQNKVKLFKTLSGSQILSKKNIDLMKTKLLNTKIYLKKSRLVLKGEVKDAINYPEKNMILISSHFCRTEMADVSARSVSLLFHEFLGLMMTEANKSLHATFNDQQYQVSGKLLDLLSEKNLKSNYENIVFEDELGKELSGKKSAFGGKVKENIKYMVENYGGRFDSQNPPSVSVMQTGSSTPREIGKYSVEQYDKQWKTVTDWDNTFYVKWDHHASASYIVSVQFESTTTGSWETEGFLYSCESSHHYQDITESKISEGLNDTEFAIPKNISDRIVDTHEMECSPLSVAK